jgi:predicted nucleic acid-binding protein
MEISKELLRDAKGVFVDTWGWIALGYYHDPHHEEVKCIYQELRQRQIPIYQNIPF